MTNKQRELIWSLVSNKKTKDDFFKISSIVNKLEAMMASEHQQGILDAVEELSVKSEFDGATKHLLAKFPWIEKGEPT